MLSIVLTDVHKLLDKYIFYDVNFHRSFPIVMDAWSYAERKVSSYTL